MHSHTSHIQKFLAWTALGLAVTFVASLTLLS